MSVRGVVRHVRYWRGEIKRWSTVYPYNGTPTSAITVADAQTLLEADNKMLYPGPVISGGAYECQFYNQASGGVPIATYIKFDWSTPAEWVSPVGSVWDNPTSFHVNEPAEGALLVTWPAGLSSTGKPVYLRKWYHQVPVVDSDNGQPDISATSAAALQTQANAMRGLFGSKGLVLGSPSGRLGGTAHVDRFYNNHQMRRGRRRKNAHVSSSDFGRILQIVEGQAYSGT